MCILLLGENGWENIACLKNGSSLKSFYYLWTTRYEYFQGHSMSQGSRKTPDTLLVGVVTPIYGCQILKGQGDPRKDAIFNDTKRVTFFLSVLELNQFLAESGII